MTRFKSYFSTVTPLARLVWRASPLLFITSTLLMLVMGVLPALNILIVSALLQRLTVVGIQSEDSASFVVLVCLLGGINLLGQVAERLSQTLCQMHGIRVSNHVQELIAAKTTSVDMASFEDRRFHDEMRTVSDEAPHRPRQMVNDLMRIVTTVTSIGSLAAILVSWRPWIFLVLLGASVATVWVSGRFGTAQVALIAGRAETERRKQYLNSLFVSDQSAKELRLFGLRALLLGRFTHLLGLTYTQDRNLALKELSYGLPAGLLLAAAEAALIGFTAFQAVAGEISVGQFNQYMLSIVLTGTLLSGLAFSFGSLHESNLFSQRLFRFLATPIHVEVRRPLRNRARPAAAPKIEFDGVSFAYPGQSAMILKDVTFQVPAGERLAIVGYNGAGKSTIVKLLSGLYEPSAGRILFDGTDIATLDREELRSYISVVFQDFTIYHFSAHDNVGVGRLDRMDDEELIRTAAQRSGLHQVVSELPDGYQTVLSRFWDKGHELSGGQRQAVALARALMRDAPILVLDEPSSALDVSNETRFFRSLLNDNMGLQPRTTVCITHRLAPIRHSDRILIIDRGQLVEAGSHEELIRLDALYAEMFYLQASAFSGANALSRK